MRILLSARRLGLAALTAFVFSLATTSASASTIIEVDPNNTFATAQLVSAFSLDFDPNIGTGAGVGFVNTSTTIPHVTILGGSANGTFDFFRFSMALAGLVIADIDSSPTNTNFDTMIHLFNAAGSPLATSDDDGNDPGDTPGAVVGGSFNSRIETGVLPAGDYVVAIGQFLSTASPGGVIDSPPPVGGTYTLNISAAGASASVVPEPATMLLLGSGLVAVARHKLRRRTTQRG